MRLKSQLKLEVWPSNYIILYVLKFASRDRSAHTITHKKIVYTSTPTVDESVHGGSKDPAIYVYYRVILPGETSLPTHPPTQTSTAILSSSATLSSDAKRGQDSTSSSSMTVPPTQSGTEVVEALVQR